MYLSLDVDSFKISIAVFDEGKLQSTVVISGGKSKAADERALVIHKDFRSFLKSFKPESVAIEDSILGKNFDSSKKVTAVISGCKLACQLERIPFMMIHHTHWKEHLTGKGNASKEEIRKTINKSFKWTADLTQDECDAIGVGLYYGHIK